MYSQLIAANDSTARVLKLDVDGKVVWVKRGGKDYHNPYQRLCALLFHRPKHGAHSTFQKEAARINVIRSAGSLAPEVLEVGSDYIVLSDIGTSLQDTLRTASPEEREQLVLAGMRAIDQLHQHKGWHGNAALRNLTIENDTKRIGFIDFDFSPREYMPLLFKQPYDLWQYCYSTVRFDMSGHLCKLAFKEYSLARNKYVVLAMCALLLPIALILSPFAHKLGRDTGQIVKTITTLI